MNGATAARRQVSADSDRSGALPHISEVTSPPAEQLRHTPIAGLVHAPRERVHNDTADLTPALPGLASLATLRRVGSQGRGAREPGDTSASGEGDWQPAGGSPPVIRRLVSVRGHAHHLQPDKTLGADAEKLIAAIDAATAKAYGQVLNRPLFTGLEDLVKTDGHIGLWIERVKEELGGAAGAATAAQFGYAIEALTTYLLGGDAEGWKLTYQVTSGNTRPDIVASKGTDVMWVDLTAEPSAFHIYNLKRWNNTSVCQFPHAEVTYAPLDGGTRAVIVKNGLLEVSGKPLTSVVDAKALQKQVAEAGRRLKANRLRWATKYRDSLSKRAKTARVYGQQDPASADPRARNSVYRWLNLTFAPHQLFDLDKSVAPTGGRAPRQQSRHAPMRGPYDRVRGQSLSTVEPESEQDAEARRQDEHEVTRKQVEDARLAGSILKVLGFAPASYGFWDASVSDARGVAFLEEQDPDEANKT